MLRVVVVCVLVALSAAAVTEDEITDLPGLSFTPSFKSYSGYLKATGTRRLHYWLVTAQEKSADAPVVLWLNGGPGCSSLDGLLSEHGPYLASEDGKTLRKNPYSWNRIANVLYMEAPAGVGYSYSADRNYTTDDDEVADNNYWALKNFFSRFPEFAKNEFFITGESYGGIYVPTLSARVVEDKDINFQGFAVGNGALDFELLDNSIITFGFGHGLWGDNLMLKLASNCCKDNKCNYYDNQNRQCQEAVSEASRIIGTLNIYNLYAECYRGPALTRNKTLVLPVHPPMFEKNPLVQKKKQQLLTSVPLSKVAEVPPCIDASGLTTYLNRPDVRKAIHVPADLPQWEICSSEVGAHYKRVYTNVFAQVLKVLGNKKSRVLIYNGDVDMACNFLGDEWFVDGLGQPVKKAREDWTYTAEDGSEQVAGFVKQFENLAFVTIKGSGHMVPQDKPIPAFDMFRRFIRDTDY